jgi:hypothetical protein
MSAINDCCLPCPTPPVNVPGAEGPSGTNGTPGTDGVSSFTITTAPFSLPTALSNVTVTVANSTWMAPGQNVFISDGTNLGNFKVVSLPSSSSVVLEYLDYAGDSGTGVTINTGASVVPSGLTGAAGTSGFTVAGNLSTAVGLTQALALTGSNPNVQVGTVTRTLAAAAAKTYLLFARCRLDYVGATFAAPQIINFKLRRTNNTAADVSGAVGNMQTAIITTLSYTAGEIVILAIPYTTSGVSDIIIPCATIDVLPSAGSVEAVECSLTVVELT